MSMTHRFVFENRSLDEWLLQLVDDDAAKRREAASVVVDRFYISTEVLLETGKDVSELQAEFAAAVRAAVNAPGFPAAEFVQQVLALDMAVHESWCKEDAMSALEQEPPHEAMSTCIGLACVIQALGTELLLASDLLRRMLFTRHKAYLASDAIARMGRAGLLFYGDLLRGLPSDDGNHHCARALGALLRDAPERIPEILELACAASGAGQTSAIFALGHCGKRATESCPDVEVRLRAILEANPDAVLWYALVGALGGCGRTSKTVDALLARLGSGDAWQKGVIMLALGQIGLEPERVVPALIGMLETFEEPDPDWCYHGSHCRIVTALRGFGKAAAAAVPALIRRIWQKPEQQWGPDQKLIERAEPDEEVIKLLGELGAAAHQALPALLEVRDEMRRRNAEVDASVSEPADHDDSDRSWSVAIQRIQSAAR
jgi:hypothetical protein